MSTPTAVTITTSDEELERAHGDVVRPLLVRAIEQGDQVAYVARTVIGALVLLRIFALRWDRVVGLDPPVVLVVVTLVGAIVVPRVVRLFTRRHWDIHNRAMLSVFADAATVFLAVMPGVLWPHPTYGGLLREVEPAFFLIASMASGLRLSRRAVAMGAATNTVGVSLLLWMDDALHPELVTYDSYDLVLYAILLAATALLGWMWASRTRRLVFEASNATMLAERARQRLGVYVSEEIAEQALSGRRLELGGARRDVAVLFSDLRGFTTYAERLPPERLVGELNDYLDAMVPEIRREGGIVDKYIGDAIMAVFGLVETGTDGPSRALRAAVAMNAALDRHNSERAAKGLPPLRHGIGLHVGPVVAGNIGTAERMQYTVIGDAVNLASRLESATKEQGVRVLVSADVRDAIARSGGDVSGLVPRGAIAVKGREQAMECFTLAEGATA